MKYRPIHLPNEIIDYPLFDTEKEAWDWIHDKHCHCNNEIQLNDKDYCVACEAEWIVESLKELKQNNA